LATAQQLQILLGKDRTRPRSLESIFEPLWLIIQE